MTSDLSCAFCSWQPTAEQYEVAAQDVRNHERVEHKDEMHSCGYKEDTFACKIRHQQINTGAAKANESPTDGSRWQRAADFHHKHLG